MKKLINIALTIAVLFAGMNVYADGDKTKDSKKSSTEKVLTKIENKFDTELSLESWMTELKEFTNSDSFSEEALDLENWMTIAFVSESSEFVEAKMSMEGWMTKTFNTEDTFQDEALQLETWMIDFKK